MIRKHSFGIYDMNKLNENMSLTNSALLYECRVPTFIQYISSHILPELMGLCVKIENIFGYMMWSFFF